MEDPKRDAFKQAIIEMTKQSKYDKVDALAEAVASLIDARDIPECERWLRGRLGV